jgi:hypothetical protein
MPLHITKFAIKLPANLKRFVAKQQGMWEKRGEMYSYTAEVVTHIAAYSYVTP